ncbi:MAG: SDR family NAD(P)-dependent oxidoreductase [Roseovarius sp.]
MHVVITGASRGIGAELARLYRDAGHEVSGTARCATETLLALDVTQPEDHAALATALDGKPVDLLVCNAGIYADKGQNLAGGFAPDLWAETFATNVTGVFLTIQALLPLLQGTQPGKIAILSSRLGSQDLAKGGSYIYRASKAAALNLGRNLSVDLEPLGIPVGIYHPGWVRTDMGGAQGEIGVEESAAGLKREFEALSLATTGAFRTWDGRDLPF